MIVSSSITVGQITFILRVAIQILTYGGPFLITLIILATAPRVASIETHSVINRAVSVSTVTKSTAKWVFGRLRNKHADPAPSSSFLILLIFSLLFTAFVSLSDIGFLGFYTCSIPFPSIIDTPASVSSSNDALALVQSNLITGEDPSNVKVARCDSSTVVDFGDGIFENSCISWTNSTYADTSLFSGMNTTDSDVMMPLQLTNYPMVNETIDVNAYYLGPNTQRVVAPIIQKGLAIIPDDGGVQMIMGVPQLALNKKVTIPQTMAVEVEAGCMTLGILDINLVDNLVSPGSMYYATNGTWRNYAGPDYLEDALSKTVDDIRAYFLPFFNTSTLDSNGQMASINETNYLLTRTAMVSAYQLPTTDWLSASPVDALLGNCTERVETQLGISYDNRTTAAGNACGLLGVGGSFSYNGVAAEIFERMVCATATQVNMVNATVSVSGAGSVSASITRLPSDLHSTLADYWQVGFSTFANATVYTNFLPYQRFTLSSNSLGATSHFIHQPTISLANYAVGLGSGGGAIAAMGSAIIGGGLFQDDLFLALGLLNDGRNVPQFTPAQVVQWLGQVGGSFIVASVGYNGWAALQSAPLEVESTGGHVGSCYKPWYALGFVPLLLAMLFAFGWMVLNMLRGTWFGTKVLQDAYDGVSPYTAIACPGADTKSTLLAWEALPVPRLQVIRKGYPLIGDANATALAYIRSAPLYS
ncbi:hypothetical protein H0H92_003451 [Tricholoma furcatifolium]|nr:hypothetical protein H0H92_003451 [Tricholoma furcatifolium]